VRACLGTAVDEGLIRHNPAQRVRLPHRPRIEEDEDRVRALSADQLAVLLELIHPRWRTPFRLLAATGLRYSEWIALGPQHLDLNGEQPRVKVRRRLYLGKFAPPKSKYGRRDLPISTKLADELRAYIATHPAGEHADEAIVFATDVGGALDYSNLRKRVLQPASDEVDASWVGFHTFRHTCASLLFARGANAVQVQRWLGHHSAAFTLERYIHLLEGDLGEALDLPAVEHAHALTRAQS
jgi:integrase